MDLSTLFKSKKIKALENNISELNQNITALQQEQKVLKASYHSPPPRGNYTNQKQQKSLSEITIRNPFANYCFDSVQQGRGQRYLFETTIAKRVLSIKPQYAIAEPPIIADVGTDDEVDTSTQFVKDVKRIMQSRRGVSTASMSLFNGNFGGFQKITEADILSYGRWGGLYLIFDDDDPSRDTAEGNPKKLIGMQPLDEACLWFNKPTNNFNVERYNVKIDNQTINNVHHSRIVLITDNDLFEHVPRLHNIETEVRNAQDMMLSLMASIGISRPKVASTTDSVAAQAILESGGLTLDQLLQSLKDAMLSIIEGDSDIMTALGTTLPEFIQPQLLEIASQLLATVNSISAKTGIPSLMILGSEVGSLASSKDKENFLDTIKQYRHHTRKIIRNVVSKLINARAVALPSNPLLEFDIFWAEDKTEIIQTNTAHIATINDILASGVMLEKSTKDNLINLAEKLASEML